VPNYTNIPLLLQLLPKLKLDTAHSSDMSSTQFNKRIEKVSLPITNQINRQKYYIPDPIDFDNPVHPSQLILEEITCCTLTADIYYQRSMEINPELFKMAQLQKAVAKTLMDWLIAGEFRKAFIKQGKLIYDISPLAEVIDCIAEVPGMKEDTTTPPVPDSIKRWILRWSAIIRAIAKIKNYSTDTATMTEDQANLWKSIIGDIVGAYVLRVRSTAQYGAAIDTVVNTTLKRGFDQLKAVQEGQMGNLFPKRSGRL